MRKRTTLVDQRINRRSVPLDPKQLLHAREQQIRAPSPSRAPAAPPVPPLPAQTPVIPPPSADNDLPPRPKFTTPPPENEGVKTPMAQVVSPPTPERTRTPASPERAASPKSDRSKSPVTEDKPLIAAAATVSRSGSGETSRIAPRRPGGARGPRAAPGSAASPTTHRLSGTFSGLRPKSPPSIVADPKDYIPKKKDGRVSAGAFGKRGVASGDEAEANK
jgi:hypothetical protein